MTGEGESVAPGFRPRWVWAGVAGAVAGGAATALLSWPVLQELGPADFERVTTFRPAIDAVFACLWAVLGASVGTLPLLALHRRRFQAPRPAPGIRLGEAVGCLLGYIGAELAVPLAGEQMGWIVGGVVAGAAAGTVAEALADLAGTRPRS